MTGAGPTLAGGFGAAVLCALAGSALPCLRARRCVGPARPTRFAVCDVARRGCAALVEAGGGGRFRRGRALRAHRLRRCRLAGSALRLTGAASPRATLGVERARRRSRPGRRAITGGGPTWARGFRRGRLRAVTGARALPCLAGSALRLDRRRLAYATFGIEGARRLVEAGAAGGDGC